jgi:uncharacterized protein YqgQ
MFDTFGKSPPSSRKTTSIYEVAEDGVFRLLNKRLTQFMDFLDVPSTLQQLCYNITSQLENNKASSKGITKDGLSIAIIYHVHNSLGIFFDLEIMCKGTKLKPAKIVKFAQTLNNHTDKNLDKLTKLQRLVFSTAKIIDIDIINIDIKILYQVNDMSKSTKMKAAIILYKAAPLKLNTIIDYIGIQKAQLILAEKETVNV